MEKIHPVSHVDKHLVLPHIEDPGRRGRGNGVGGGRGKQKDPKRKQEKLDRRRINKDGQFRNHILYLVSWWTYALVCPPSPLLVRVRPPCGMRFLRYCAQPCVVCCALPACGLRVLCGMCLPLCLVWYDLMHHRLSSHKHRKKDNNTCVFVQAEKCITRKHKNLKKSQMC